MVRTIIQRNLDIDNRVAGQYTTEHRAPDTGINRGNIFLRNGAALYGVDKLVTLTGVGFDDNLNVTILASTAGLTGVLGPHPPVYEPFPYRQPAVHPRLLPP